LLVCRWPPCRSLQMDIRLLARHRTGWPLSLPMYTRASRIVAAARTVVSLSDASRLPKPARSSTQQNSDKSLIPAHSECAECRGRHESSQRVSRGARCYPTRPRCPSVTARPRSAWRATQPAAGRQRIQRFDGGLAVAGAADGGSIAGDGVFTAGNGPSLSFYRGTRSFARNCNSQ
jgi:hypothetical protein